MKISLSGKNLTFYARFSPKCKRGYLANKWIVLIPTEICYKPVLQPAWTMKRKWKQHLCTINFLIRYPCFLKMWDFTKKWMILTKLWNSENNSFILACTVVLQSVAISRSTCNDHHFGVPVSHFGFCMQLANVRHH